MSAFAPDNAMVFAAGLGVRMRPLTLSTPKPLIKVGGRPMIDHILDRFEAAGVATAVVNVHYLADQIEAHLSARRRPRIQISDERAKLLDQGGGIAKALPLLGAHPFFVANTDAFWINEGPQKNLLRLGAAWDPQKMDALLLVASMTTSIGVDWSGDFAMASDGRLIRRAEYGVVPFVYTGVGIVKPELFATQTEDVFKLAPIFFEAAEKGRLFGQRLDGVWLHVGAPDAVAEAERTIAKSAL